MKKPFLLLIFTLASLWAMAQSGMTDSQIVDFYLKEQAAGTSQAQIVTKLMQNGVDIAQIRRVRQKYERQAKDKGLGLVSDASVDKATDRMRRNNGQKKEERKTRSNSRLRGNTYPPEEEEQKLMEEELNQFMPDSTLLMRQQMLEEMEKEKGPRVFGRDIFNKKNLTFEPVMNIATPQNYRLGPGDAVNIDIYGASQRSVQSTVSPDGTVTIDGFGPVQVSGLTVAQANARLRSQLGQRYASSQIKLTVGQTRTIMVNVMGEVRTPGTYTLSAFASVFHALYMAGGTSDIGTLRNIKVYRNNHLVSTVDVYDFILNGKLTGNVRLADNDVIVVGPYDCLVTVTGKVKRPMIYEMKKNESMATLLKYAGGFAGDAYTKSVRLIRKTGRELSIHTVGEFDYASFRLDDQDSVSVDSVLHRFANGVEVKGAVFRPGIYELGTNINSVRTLLQAAEGVTEEAFTTRAVMHRMKEDRTLRVIPVDVEGILNGSVADLPLQNNDVLFIPTKTEVMQERTLTIHGEVNYPGVYKYADNETLEDFVLQAGGLKETASTVKVDVARRIINPGALTTDSVIAHTYSFALKDGFVVDGQPGFTLMPFDEVYVRRSPGYSSQQNIEVVGQVMFAGVYTLSTKSERLSEAVRKAGGLKETAYTRGARLERRLTLDERRRMETVLRMAKTQSGKKDSLDLNKIDLGDTYYVGIELDKALAHPGSDADIVLREGDRIIVPEYNGTVKISGNVMYPNTVSYERGKSVRWYIDQAGGFGNRAKRSHTYVIYMNGKVARVGRNAVVRPGCEIVVPSKPESSGLKLAEWLTIGSSVTSIATMLVTLANVLR